ncbi:MAG: dimethyl sulfoxide reductase anchor subunit [Burkholderiales bacterium]|nr:dimethyl sulfoxide reductase anchor subunit [Burkholderiales bacterium]
MNPAWSVVFFTTLAGAGQGLVLALFEAEWARRAGFMSVGPGPRLVAAGALAGALLACGGLISSFLHLGRPERAWRAAAMWRTSWLSREVIVLPGFIALALAYGAAQIWLPEIGFVIGAAATVAALVLFLCTGMIYACIRFLQEWASPLTPINFTLLGCANGFSIAAAMTAAMGAEPLHFFAVGAIGFTIAGLVGRAAAWRRNARRVPMSTLQTAIGITHRHITQQAQGFSGGSFNTREFFHGRSAAAIRLWRRFAVVGAFLLPLALLVAGSALASALLLGAAAVIQYAGLLAERWLFFAEANHPQNLYYQRAG